jgi:hypothetical protein
VSRLRVAPIVEGHGEVQAVRILLARIWCELLGGEHVDVLKPIRIPRSKLVQAAELQRAVSLAWSKLEGGVVAADPKMVLILLDADRDPACVLGPTLLLDARADRADADIACVLPNVEYETWFVAAAESLGGYFRMAPEEGVPENPERDHLGKGWVKGHFRGAKYSETLDQPRMTAAMDLGLCRRRSPSFAKLCRELERRLGNAPATPDRG